MEDNYLQQGKRERLAKELKRKGIYNLEVLNAIKKVPRHFFVDKIFEHHAYEDKPFSIGEGQTISQPYTVAFQTQLLDIKSDEKVLEIGTGSGYQAAILFQLTKNLFSIERQKLLFNKTKKLLNDDFKYKIKLFLGDGTIGLSKHAPFDKIIITAGAPSIPTKLISQLNIGGIMVLPVGNENEQKMYKITRISEKDYESETFSGFSFVPLVGEDGW